MESRGHPASVPEHGETKTRSHGRSKAGGQELGEQKNRQNYVKVKVR